MPFFRHGGKSKDFLHRFRQAAFLRSPGLALDQPSDDDLSQGPEDVYAGNEAWVVPPPIPTVSGPSATGSILDTILSTGASVIKSITQPDVVKAALMQGTFGAQPVNPATGLPYGYAKPTGEIIPGIPNTYLLVGGGVLLFFLMSRGRR